MKWANTVEKIKPKDLLDAGLPQTFNLLKKKKKKQLSVFCTEAQIKMFVPGISLDSHPCFYQGRFTGSY